MLLITTSLDCKKINEPSLLLGEWCRTNENFNSKKIKACSYHWDDAEKQIDDYLHIKNIYEEYLEELTNQLNDYHGLEFSVVQWEIIIGSWLRCFISICYDRYENLKYAFSNYKITAVLNVKNESKYQFNNSLEFFRDGAYDDGWNQNLIIQIFKCSNFNKNINLKVVPSSSKMLTKFKKRHNKNIKGFVKNLLSRINEKLIKRNKIVFHGLDIGLYENFKLNLGFYQFPCVFLSTKYDFNSTQNRKKLMLKPQTNSFKKILSDILVQHIPLAYIENFKKIYEYVDGNYPQNTKIIVTATSYYKDEYFKIWVAQQKNKLSKYVIHQHGGNYGDTDYSDEEELQIKTCDKFLTWGWIRNETFWKNKISKVPSLKLSILKKKINYKIKYNPDGKIVLPLYEWPKFSYRLYSGPISSQQLYYNKQIITFCNNLNKYNRSKLIFAGPPVDRGWCTRQVLVENGFGDFIDKKSLSFFNHLKSSKLAVIHVKSTSMLETLSFNFPTICVFDKKYWKINKQATYYYDLLSDVNILFDTSIKASDWLNHISKNLDDWWYNERTQSAIKEFVKNYAYTEQKYIKMWIKKFKDY